MPKYTTRWWIILLALWLWVLHPISAQINITCKYDHIPLSEVLKDLHQTYGLKFAYDEQLVKNKFVTITLNDIPLPQALDKILWQVELEAVNINQVWIVKKRKDTPIKPALKKKILP